jgi:hypothetical protein
MSGPMSSEERVEEVLRAVYRDRAAMPGAPSKELAARVTDVPSMIRPDRRGWVGRSAWVAAVAAAVVVALASLERLRALSRGATPDVGGSTAFDPVHPGSGLIALSGVTFEGVKGVLSAMSGLFLGLLAVALAWAAIQWARGLGQPQARRRPRRPLERKAVARDLVKFALFLGGYAVVSSSFGHLPLTAGSTAGPGLGVTQQRSDGHSTVVLYGDRYSEPTGGPRDIFAVAPGQPLTYLVSVRNAWPVPITIEGRWLDRPGVMDITAPPGSTPTGLGLLRDPSRAGGSVENTVPFTPVTLWSGQEVVLVVSEVARPCADPSIQIPIRTTYDSRDIGLVPSFQLVYSVFGVVGVTAIVPTREVTVPSTCPRVQSEPIRIDP